MLASSIACLAWSWAAGRDLNFDQLHYHFYSAYHYLENRLERDFMGASIHGYLNPLGYVPFYLMVRANWGSLFIGSFLALVHSTCLWLVYAISRELIPVGTISRTWMIAASVALAFLAPIYLVEVGSSFIDVTTSIPVLAGILLLMVCARSERRGVLVLLAGLLMGAASGLKLTNAIFAVTASAFIVLAARPVQARVGALGLYAAGGCAGFLIADGAWAYQLFRTFGSPFFPFFNGWFQSPDFPAFDYRHHRFVPETLGDYLLFPLRMLDLRDNVYTETRAPDIRLLALLALLVVTAIAHMIRRRQAVAMPAEGSDEPARPRTNVAAVTFFLASYLLWLATSGNGRYAVALELFVAPMIVASAIVFTRSRRTLGYLLGALLLAQAIIVYVGADRRYIPTAWKAKWFDLEVPALLQQRNFLYLSLDAQSAAFLAPFLTSGSSFINLVGQSSMALDRPGGKRLRSLLDRHHPDIRTLIPVRAQTETGQPHPVIFPVQDTLLERVGLRSDPNQCLSIVLRDVVIRRVLVPSDSEHPKAGFVPDNTQFLSCATMPVASIDAASPAAARRAQVDRAFDLLETRCPRHFSPAGTYTDHINTTFSRNYLNSDAILKEIGGLIQYSGWRPGPPVVLGTTEDILAGRTVPDCRSISQLSYGTRK